MRTVNYFCSLFNCNNLTLGVVLFGIKCSFTGTRSPEVPTEGTHVSVCAMLEETESWDDEIEANITQNGPCKYWFVTDLLVFNAL